VIFALELVLSFLELWELFKEGFPEFVIDLFFVYLGLLPLIRELISYMIDLFLIIEVTLDKLLLKLLR
jgi:hypothetical protein